MVEKERHLNGERGRKKTRGKDEEVEKVVLKKREEEGKKWRKKGSQTRIRDEMLWTH